MTRLTPAMFLSILALIILTGCSENVYTLKDEHMVPAYTCEGAPVPSAAAWTYSGPKAKVRIYTDKGHLLCETGVKRQFCFFNKILDPSDIPLNVKVLKKGKVVYEREINYVVLSGPRDTQDFSTWNVEQDEKTVTVKIITPIYGTCEEDEEKECTDRTDDQGNPIVDEEGNVIQDCYCPDEGRVIDTKTETVQRSMRTPTAIWWSIGETWFGPRVVTRGVTYRKGEIALIFTGPISGDKMLSPGQGAIVNNGGRPAGIWLGNIPEGQTVTTDPSGAAVFEHRLRFTIACEEQ